MPPTCRSISATVISPRCPLHHRLTSSGVVHARYTRCFGASNSRVMRICSSVGRVTVAVPLLGMVSISFSFAFEVFQHGIELVEPLRPRALVVLHPVVNGLERLAVDSIQPLPSNVSNVDRSDFAEHPQVLG